MAEGMRKDLDQKQIAIVVGLFVVLLAVLYFFVLSGGDEGGDLGAPPPIEEPLPTEEPVEEPAEPDEGPVETFEVFTRRDPFEPVIDLRGGGAIDDVIDGEGDDPGDKGTNGTDTNGTGTDGSDTNGTDTGDDTGGDGGDSSGQTVGGHRVKLIDVFTKNGNQRAQIQVDGTVYTVDPGESFADSFELVSISGDCAAVLFGDDQFTICEGEEILK